MEKNSFSIREALTIGWQKSWRHAHLLMQTFLIWGGYMIIAYIISRFFITAEPLKTIFSIVRTLIGTLFSVGAIRIYYEIEEYDKSSYTQLFKNSQHIITYLLAGLGLAGLIFLWVLSIGGIAFFLLKFNQHNETVKIVIAACAVTTFIGGILRIITKYTFSPVAIVSNDAQKATQALRASAALTQGHKLKIFLFLILSTFLIALTLGFMTSVVGIAWVHIYKVLKAKHN